MLVMVMSARASTRHPQLVRPAATVIAGLQEWMYEVHHDEESTIQISNSLIHAPFQQVLW